MKKIHFLPYIVKAEPEPTACDKKSPKILCVPIPYTKEEISEIWDWKGQYQQGGFGGLLSKEGVKKIKDDCPKLCSKYNGKWQIDDVNGKIDFENKEVSFSCPCKIK